MLEKIYVVTTKNEEDTTVFSSRSAAEAFVNSFDPDYMKITEHIVDEHSDLIMNQHWEVRIAPEGRLITALPTAKAEIFKKDPGGSCILVTRHVGGFGYETESLFHVYCIAENSQRAVALAQIEVQKYQHLGDK